MRTIHSLAIRDEAEVGAARRAVHRFAVEIGFTETELAEIDIVVQEIGTNAARYATDGGRLHFTTMLGGEPGVELFYWDKGPGIDDLDRVVRDGVSTSGGLGAGLGALQRLMDEFDVYSTVRATPRNLRATKRRTTHGTTMLGRKLVAALRHSSEISETSLTKRVGAWSRPRLGEEVNGDAYFIRSYAGSMLYAVIDGLGHGRGARAAAEVALDSLGQWKGEPLEEVFWAVHDALRATRGAVMGAVIVDKMGETFYYAGIGNIDVRVFNVPQPTRPIPSNGTLGARLPHRVRVSAHKWSEGAIIVMVSDGLSASWDIAAYPGLLGRSPQLLAGVLLRDYGRDSDDATILVVR